MQSFFAEMTASFLFGYTIYAAILNTKFANEPNSPLVVNIAILASAIAIIYTFCDLTITHFNPAITLAAILTRKLDPFNGVGFIISQLIGFMLAAILTVVNFPGTFLQIMREIRATPGDTSVTNVNIFFAEFTLTAILVFVAFSTSINALRNPDYSLYGDEPLPNRTIVAPLTIGLTLGFLSFLAGKTSGGAFNPGLVFAPMMLSMRWHHCWEYFVGEFTGGLFGALLQVWILFK
jgi:glycerol uptake facilitator-like aquaporin